LQLPLHQDVSRTVPKPPPQIKPATRTRIDFGFALGNTKATGRLIDTGGFAKKDRITHRIPIAALTEIDGEVKKWLRVAYDRDA
jgi:hypothetical protein